MLVAPAHSAARTVRSQQSKRVEPWRNTLVWHRSHPHPWEEGFVNSTHAAASGAGEGREVSVCEGRLSSEVCGVAEVERGGAETTLQREGGKRAGSKKLRSRNERCTSKREEKEACR